MDEFAGVPDEVFAAFGRAQEDSSESLESKYGFSHSDMERCIKVMNCLRADSDWVEDPKFKQLRAAGLCVGAAVFLCSCAQDVDRTGSCVQHFCGKTAIQVLLGT
jgi:hypothetical protein